MTPEPASNELVLRRAFELAEIRGEEVGGFEELTPRQLGEIAAEVGLPLGPWPSPWPRLGCGSRRSGLYWIA